MEFPKRKPNRLRDYDYSQNGAYFITICIKDMKEILWDPRGGYHPPEAIQLSNYGSIIDKAINDISKYYKQIAVDKYVVMPNHVHMIVVITGDEDGRLIIAPTVSRILQQLKRYVSKEAGSSIWQKSFYDRVIRDEMEYQQIWQYIDENPLKWQEDCYYRGE